MIVLLLATIFLTLPAEVEAKSKVAAIEGMSYNVNSSLVDNLKSLIGKKVNVTVASGKTFSGVVKEVGMHLLHLEKLAGKDYFDALIRIENISAIDAQFRKFQR
jgi:small nuclear ribonucleoprotein (snRNP)-like protein